MTSPEPADSLVITLWICEAHLYDQDIVDHLAARPEIARAYACMDEHPISPVSRKYLEDFLKAPPSLSDHELRGRVVNYINELGVALQQKKDANARFP